jgi:hypothetical protein
MAEAVAWRVRAWGGKISRTWSGVEDPLLPEDGSVERMVQDLEQSRVCAGLKAAYARRWDIR